ncbi:protein yellow-like [Anoplophora glabripennis]|uniref:protein yellow-like n=1 Tax=Anoplophora glabripennis TaxID=217634 RepID=UPI00087499E7|nr:protein yellow-like [Anoplophora glabripennis]
MKCILIHYLVFFYCAARIYDCHITLSPNYRFDTEYEWSHLNYTWPSVERYTEALKSGDYIPEHNAPTGMKIYNENLYLSMPKFRKGVPVTLAYIRMSTTSKTKNELLSPFPNWETNDACNCTNLQSVQSMEIDTNGIMWVLDGVRINDNTNCPTKLVLFDLNNNGSLLHSFVFPNEISLQNGGFLNDIVIDDSDGSFAYITDNSNIDPGLVVYSKKKNRAWKVRDRTMFPEPAAANFVVNNKAIENLIPIDGIALSPKPLESSENRTVFYTSITSFHLFAISTTVLKDEQLCKTDRWRKNIQYVGEKQSQTDGMMMDSSGTLYYTLLPFYGVGSWNIRDPFVSSKIVNTDRDVMVWPDGFAMDQRGFLYLISNMIVNYINPTIALKLTPDVKFRISKLYTGTKSYLYPLFYKH